MRLSNDRSRRAGARSVSAAAGGLLAGESAPEDLAKKLSNPIASLISIPLQGDSNDRSGPARDGRRLHPQHPGPGHSDRPEQGLEPDLAHDPTDHQSERHRPRCRTSVRNRRCGAELVLLAQGPDGRRLDLGRRDGVLAADRKHDLLSARKWGAGPTAVALRAGIGVDVRPAVSITSGRSPATATDRALTTRFCHRSLAYTTKDAWTFGLNAESTLRLECRAVVGAHQRECRQAREVRQAAGEPRIECALLGGARRAPHGWGLRFIVTFLFPRVTPL